MKITITTTIDVKAVTASKAALIFSMLSAFIEKGPYGPGLQLAVEASGAEAESCQTRVVYDASEEERREELIKFLKQFNPDDSPEELNAAVEVWIDAYPQLLQNSQP